MRSFHSVAAYLEGRIAWLVKTKLDLQAAYEEISVLFNSPLVQQLASGFAFLERISDLDRKILSLDVEILRVRKQLYDVRSKAALGEDMLAQLGRRESTKVAERNLDELAQRTACYSLLQD
jgi:hypothetical protein